MKKILILILLLFSFTGCSSNKPIILTNQYPFSELTIKHCQKSFLAGQKIYYLVAFPEGEEGFYFEDIKIRVLKKAEASGEFWGLTPYMAQNKKVKPGDLYFTDYLVIPQKGMYYLQVLYLANMTTPLAIAEILIH